jgi:hypothetical protein
MVGSGQEQRRLPALSYFLRFLWTRRDDSNINQQNTSSMDVDFLSSQDLAPGRCAWRLLY